MLKWRMLKGNGFDSRYSIVETTDEALRKLGINAALRGAIYRKIMRIMISVVIPVYRASDSLFELVQRLEAVLSWREEVFEILFVEDCGADDSWRVIQELSKTDNRVRGFRMSRNYGQHNALLCGIREARGEVIVTMDDDLQHPPEELPKLLAKLEEGLDVVYGPPREEQRC
jgi:undecaprenyl-phosphate 4-deoxy-4-formamido-L-arabinose transferase